MRSCWKQQWGMYLACTHLPFRNCFGGKSIVGVQMMWHCGKNYALISKWYLCSHFRSLARVPFLRSLSMVGRLVCYEPIFPFRMLYHALLPFLLPPYMFSDRSLHIDAAAQYDRAVRVVLPSCIPALSDPSISAFALSGTSRRWLASQPASPLTRRRVSHIHTFSSRARAATLRRIFTPYKQTIRTGILFHFGLRIYIYI
jgi:hypothetical protein